MSETNCSTCSRTGRNWTIETCCAQPFCVDEHYQHSRTGPPEPSCFQQHYTDEHAHRADPLASREEDWDDERPNATYRSLED